MIPLSLAIGYLRDLYLIKGGLAMDNSLVIGFMRRILRMDSRFFRDYPKGELESRLSDTGKIRLFICDGVVSFGVCAVTLLQPSCRPADALHSCLRRSCGSGRQDKPPDEPQGYGFSGSV